MADNNATILIPDISGFTEFVTGTELGHGSHAINMLLEAVVEAVSDEYEISEIEGDAVLMFKRGAAPSKKEIQDTCIRIFNAFHLRRKWMQQRIICPCGACQAVINLTLKFVAHHGPVGEMKIGRFTTLSGTDVIVAHRLLKNSVDSNEYLLLSEKLWQQFPDSNEPSTLEWKSLSDEFASIGKVDYRFAKLEEARKKTPDPPPLENNYSVDNTSRFEISIYANYRDVHMIMSEIPDRSNWVPGLKKVEQDTPDVYIGSVHHCYFENYTAVISPLRMTLSDDGIIYAESCEIEKYQLSLVYEYVFRRVNDKNCVFSCRILNRGKSSIPDEINTMLFDQMKQTAEKLKIRSEELAKPFF